MNFIASALGLALGLLAGGLSGVFGIGGRVVLVPLLALGLGLSQHQAQGVTLTVLLLPIGHPAALAYHRRSRLHLPLVAALVIGFHGGVGLGSAAAGALPDGLLRATFIAFLLLASILLHLITSFFQYCIIDFYFTPRRATMNTAISSSGIPGRVSYS